MLISVRAHGDSTGNVDDVGFGARLDVAAAVEWLDSRHPGLPVVIHGRSLGAAAAVFAAAKLPSRVAGYILECPYRDLATQVRHRCALFLPPILDSVAATGLILAAHVLVPEAAATSPLEAIASMPAAARVLFLAGGADQRAHLVESQDLLARCPARARLEVFEGADHLELQVKEPERYERLIAEFVDEVGSTSEDR